MQPRVVLPQHQGVTEVPALLCAEGGHGAQHARQPVVQGFNAGVWHHAAWGEAAVDHGQVLVLTPAMVGSERALMQGQGQASVSGERLVQSLTAVLLTGHLTRLQLNSCIALLQAAVMPQKCEAAVLMMESQDHVHTWGTGAHPAEQLGLCEQSARCSPCMDKQQQQQHC